MSASQDETPVWYFAYGSNMKRSVMENRGITLLAARTVMVPDYVLTFDVFGVPYSEPAMASIAPRSDFAADRYKAYGYTPATALNHPAATTIPPVHGIAYLISAADFRGLVISEGAGIAYLEIELETELLDSSDKQGRTLTARTLVARYPFRPNALPSTRYMSLLIQGADEASLPREYGFYLSALHSYTKDPSMPAFERYGAIAFHGLWLPVLSWMMRRIKAAALKRGRAKPQEWLGTVVWLMFMFMWLHYDVLHCRIFGHGGGRHHI